MKGRYIAAVLAGGAAAFVWSSISWMALPWHRATMSVFEDEAAIGLAIKKAAPEPGIYTYPGWTDDAADMERKHQEGPYVFSSVVPAGVGSEMGIMMVRGFLIDVVAAGLLLMVMLRAAEPGWKSCLRLGVLAALFVSVVPSLMHWGWWHYPIGFTVVEIVDGMIVWTLASFVMAKIVRPNPKAAPG